MPIIEQNEEKGKYEWIWKEYIGDVVAANIEAQRDPRNGFGLSREGACGRHIGRIPVPIYKQWQREFTATRGKGHDDWTREWKPFLRRKIDQDPRARMVDKLLHINPNSGNIIIK